MRTVEYRETLTGTGPYWGVNDGKNFYPFSKAIALEVAKEHRSLNGYIYHPLENTALVEEPC